MILIIINLFSQELDGKSAIDVKYREFYLKTASVLILPFYVAEDGTELF